MPILYNINAYVCNLEINLKWKELLCSQEIVNRILKGMLCANYSHKRTISVFLVEPRLCLQCVELRWNELFPKFWRRFCTNQGRENFVLLTCVNVSWPQFPNGHRNWACCPPPGCLLRERHFMAPQDHVWLPVNTSCLYCGSTYAHFPIKGVSPKHYHWLTGSK